MTSFECFTQPCLCSASLMGLFYPFDDGGVLGWPDRNTRRSERIAGFFEVDLIAEGVIYRCVTHNLSYHGLFIETGREWKTGRKISLVVKMTSPGVNFEVEGIIIRNSPHGIGVQLIRN